jgi:GAF domain-containing protein
MPGKAYRARDASATWAPGSRPSGASYIDPPGLSACEDPADPFGDSLAEMSKSDTQGAGPAAGPVELSQRDAFVQAFFKRGAEITEELIRENERLREQVAHMERELAALRTQLASDDTLRVALRKIEDLEREKRELLSHIESEAVSSTRFAAHHAQVEMEIANLANLYVALYQLHSSLDVKEVTARLRDLLAQLIGAREFAIYVAAGEGKELVPLATSVTAKERAPRIALRDSVQPPPGAPTLVERVFLTGVAHVAEGRLTDLTEAVACVPLKIGQQTIGVIVVYSVLTQKECFLPVDFELFKLLGAHAATALMGAMLHAQSGGIVPNVEAVLSLPQ